MNNAKYIYAGVFVAAIAGIGLLKVLGGNSPVDGYTQPHAATVPTAQPQGTTNSGELQFPPDFTLQNIDGGTITLSDFRGEKPVILDFFASWCHNCQRAMPKLSKWYDQYKDDVEIIGVNLRENKKTVEKFVKKLGITYPIVLDSGGTSRNYNVRYTNTHVLINKDGSLLRVVPGDLNESHIKSLTE